MRFSTALLARLVAALFLVCTVVAAPVAVTTSSTGLGAAGQEGVVAGARITQRDVSSSSTRAGKPESDHAGAADDATESRPRSTMWALKDRLLLKRQPNAALAEPKRFTLDDFTTIAAANEKYDGLRPEGAGFVGLKQRGLPGWSRIY